MTMRLLDFGAWDRSWGDTETRISRQLTHDGWHECDRNDDLIEYRNNRTRLRISHYGYAIIDDDGTADRIMQSLHYIWMSRRADAYPQSANIDRVEDVGWIILRNALRQSRTWLCQSIRQGTAKDMRALVGRCDRILYLHPMFDNDSQHELVGRLKREADLIQEEARNVHARNTLYPLTTFLQTLLTPVAVFCIGFGDYSNPAMTMLGMGLALMAGLCAPVNLFDRFFGD